MRVSWLRGCARHQFCTAVAQNCPFCTLSTSYTERGHCTDYAAVLLRTLTTYRASKKLGLEQAVLGTRNFNEVDLEESEARKVPLLCVTVFRRTTQCIVFLCYSKVVVSCCDVVHPLMSNCTISTPRLNFLSSLSDNFELRAASYHCRAMCWLPGSQSYMCH
jgi:hypothetical protein